MLQKRETQIVQLRSLVVLSILLLIFVACLSAEQQSGKPTGEISVRQILSKNLVAIGGLEAFHGAKTLEANGEFGYPGMRPSGYFQFIYKAPFSDVLELAFMSSGQSAAGRRNGRPFVKMSSNATFSQDGVTTTAMEEALYCWFESDSEGRQEGIELVGLTDLKKKWAYALRFAPNPATSHVNYYDSETFLLVRTEMAQRFRSEENGPDKAYRVDVEFKDYRVTENLRFPWLLSANAGRGNVEFRVTKIRENVSVDDSKFAGM
ncbi:MAG: hypothetical protein WBV36_07605 [Terriglobales bacterium]